MGLVGLVGLVGMIMKSRRATEKFVGAVLLAIVTTVAIAPMFAQVRTSRRGAVAKGDDAAVAAGPRGVAAKGEDGYAAAGRRGAVVSGDEGTPRWAGTATS